MRHGAIGLTLPATSGGSPGAVSPTRSVAKLLLCTALCGVGLTLGGCASQDRVAQGSPSVDRFNSRYGVSSSPRVVEEGRPVPRGGGVYRVGRPYTVAGRRYTPFEKREGHTETGIASWYGRQFHGRLTANGEVYDMHTLSAAHRTMPMPSYARVTNLSNGHSLIVRVNDRGPFHGNRVIDLSHRASNMLNFRGQGLARVRVEYVGRAPLEGSDDRQLLATLRTDGSPAPRPNQVTPTMIASAAPQTVPDPAPRQAQPAVAAASAQPVLASASSEPAPAPAFGFFRQDMPSPDMRQPDPAPAVAATTQPQVAASPVTMASAPLPMARPGMRDSAPPATTVVARTTGPAQVASTVTVVATPAPQSAPASAPVLATASSRPVAIPAATAFAPPARPAPAIQAMPGGAPVRAALGFGALY